MRTTRTITKAEAVIVYKQELSLKQHTHVSNIMQFLGRYMALEHSQIINLYEKAYGNTMGKSYLARAVSEKFIIEYKKDTGKPKAEGEKDVYFYTLQDEVGYHLLKLAKKPYIEMPDCGVDELSRILTASHYMIKNDYRPYTRSPVQLKDDVKFFFVTKYDVVAYKDKMYVLYFRAETIKKVIPQNNPDGTLTKAPRISQHGTTIEKIQKYFEKQKGYEKKPEQQAVMGEFIESLTYVEITSKMADAGDNTKATDPTDAHNTKSIKKGKRNGGNAPKPTNQQPSQTNKGQVEIPS